MHICTMFKSLEKKWKVGPKRLFLILLSFALGGTACGIIGKLLMKQTGLVHGIAYTILYIVLITLLWPLCVLLISSLFGEFPFFKTYLLQLGKKILGQKKAHVYRLAIFASGGGSNAEKIINYFQEKENSNIKPALVVSNKSKAGVLSIAKVHGIETFIIGRPDLVSPATLVRTLKEKEITHIILAGFMQKIPFDLLHAYPNKIINIHPALLPAYGGQGMYGHFVHEAVVAAGEKETGCSIHEVDEIYDNGKIIYQATCPVYPGDSAADVAARVLIQEHLYYAPTIEKWINEIS